MGTGISSSVADQDTVRNPFYFYIDSETGAFLVKPCVVVFVMARGDAQCDSAMYDITDVKCTQTFCINDTTGEIKLNDVIVSIIYSYVGRFIIYCWL